MVAISSVRHAVGHYEVRGTHVVDLRDAPPDVFRDVSATDWSRLRWSEIGTPYTVDRWAAGKTAWEAEHGRMSVHHGWTMFNRNFHRLFSTDVPSARREARSDLARAIAEFDVPGARHAVEELVQLAVWNRVQRVEDAVWDPRGKRALFADLGVRRPRILFLGAADGYEAMQLYAQYPGGDVTLVDYDDFCRTDRFGEFPAAYPFLGTDPTTGHRKVWYREEMPIDFDVRDIRNLDYGAEFDVVMSVGLIEHFPDAHKPEVFELHRRFVKPGGVVIMTCPRNQWRSKAFYTVMADLLNYGYRELMDVWQFGRYAWQNGFDIRRAGVIKAHNGLICAVR